MKGPNSGRARLRMIAAVIAVCLILLLLQELFSAPPSSEPVIDEPARTESGPPMRAEAPVLVEPLPVVPTPDPTPPRPEPARPKPETCNGVDLRAQAPPPSPEVKRALVMAGRGYFDLGVDLFHGRKRLKEALAKSEQAGFDIWANHDALIDLIMQARTFDNQMGDKRWRRDNEITQWDTQGSVAEIQGDGLHLGFSLPKKYPKRNKTFDKYPRVGPWPLLLSTIELQDFTGTKIKSASMLKRRYPKSVWKDFRNAWMTLIPIAPGGVYINPTSGRLDRERLQWQFVKFIRHYHVDFDRIVLDGGTEVLLAASSQPMTYAGFVIRDGTLSEEQAKTVTNFAHVPVYVLASQQRLADALKAAGHKSVTVGDGGATLVAWLGERKRCTPRSFTWRLERPAHQFAHWINCEEVDWYAPTRELVVDVDDASNTIRIVSEGVGEVSLFLNSAIVDLHRPVRLIINGTLVKTLVPGASLDVCFNRDPLKLRKSMYFGLLFPARIIKIPVPAPK